jgi:hypothetical protein
MLPTLSDEPFKFSSPHGWQVCRKIITDKLPFGPHDYQLEGITQALDGHDVVAVSATGSGKSAYIMLAIILLELVKDPLLSPIKDFLQIQQWLWYVQQQSSDAFWFGFWVEEVQNYIEIC